MGQLEVVRSLSVEAGQGTRFDCPFCGGSNCFSVDKDRGKLKWFCFRASCPARGIADYARTPADIRSLLANPEEINTRKFVLPDHIMPLSSDEAAVELVRKYNAMPAYLSKDAGIMFDPKQRRVVFLIRDVNGAVVGAAGRVLKPGRGIPKWFRYDGTGLPFVCGKSATAVVVEDALSACAVSPVATGIALLGTNLQDSYLPTLKRFDQVIVALDPDAARKSLQLQKTLSFFVRSRVALIKDDLKYFSPPEIAEMLGVAHEPERGTRAAA